MTQKDLGADVTGGTHPAAITETEAQPMVRNDVVSEHQAASSRKANLLLGLHQRRSLTFQATCMSITHLPPRRILTHPTIPELYVLAFYANL